MTSSLSQVVIPFDSQSDVKTVRDHVMKTIAQVVSKVSKLGDNQTQCYRCYKVHSYL